MHSLIHKKLVLQKITKFPKKVKVQEKKQSYFLKVDTGQKTKVIIHLK